MPVAKTHEPDKQALAALLNRAKGDRTLKEFAGLCGVNPSTLTRIMQQTNRGSSTLELIEAIAENAALESGVTLDALLNANGYTRVYSASSMPAYASHAEAMARNAILNGLLLRDAEVHLENTRYRISKSMSFQPDIQIRTDLFGEDRRVWMLEVLPPFIRTQSDLSARGGKDWATRAKQKAFQTISRLSLFGTQASGEQTPARYSIVTTEKQVFSLLVEEFRDMLVPVTLSLILVDTELGVVDDEFFLPPADGSRKPQSFFTQERAAGSPPVSEFDDNDDRVTIQGG